MDQVVTLARRASAFRTAAGTFYCLFETTYRKNAHNPQQETRCVAFGHYDDVIRWILTAVASCESGMLQGLNGSIDPADYLRHWRHALRRPDDQFTQPIWVKASTAPGATVPLNSPFAYNGSRLPFAVQMLSQHGYPELAKRVKCGQEVVLDLHRDAAVLAKIYGGPLSSRISPAGIIQPHGVGEGNPALAPPRRVGRRSPPAVAVFHLDDPGRLVVMTKGFEAVCGSRDEVLFEFTRMVAAELEVKQDDAGLAAVASLKDALAGIIHPAPDTLRLAIDRAALGSMILFRGHLERIERGVKQKPGVSHLAVSVRALRKAGVLSNVAALPSFCVGFRSLASTRVAA